MFVALFAHVLEVPRCCPGPPDVSGGPGATEAGVGLTAQMLSPTHPGDPKDQPSPPRGPWPFEPPWLPPKAQGPEQAQRKPATSRQPQACPKTSRPATEASTEASTEPLARPPRWQVAQVKAVVWEAPEARGHFQRQEGGAVGMNGHAVLAGAAVTELLALGRGENGVSGGPGAVRRIAHEWSASKARRDVRNTGVT